MLPAGLVMISNMAASASQRIGSTPASHWLPKNTCTIGSASAAMPTIAGTPSPIWSRMVVR